MTELHFVPERMGLLRAVFTGALLSNVYRFPDEYEYTLFEAYLVADAIMNHVERETMAQINLDGHAWRMTAVLLGIDCSYPAFRDFLKGA